MQFSLRVICNYNIVDAVKPRIEALTNYLCLSSDYAFAPYWKDDGCAILEISARIENFIYSEIVGHIQSISGVGNLYQYSSSDNWECAYFASLDELHSSNGPSFVVCNIFEVSN